MFGETVASSLTGMKSFPPPAQKEAVDNKGCRAGVVTIIDIENVGKGQVCSTGHRTYMSARPAKSLVSCWRLQHFTPMSDLQQWRRNIQSLVAQSSFLFFILNFLSISDQNANILDDVETCRRTLTSVITPF